MASGYILSFPAAVHKLSLTFVDPIVTATSGPLFFMSRVNTGSHDCTIRCLLNVIREITAHECIGIELDHKKLFLLILAFRKGIP